MPDTCPEPDEWAGYVVGGGFSHPDEKRRAEIDRHVEQCNFCRDLLIKQRNRIRIEGEEAPLKVRINDHISKSEHEEALSYGPIGVFVFTERMLRCADDLRRSSFATSLVNHIRTNNIQVPLGRYDIVETLIGTMNGDTPYVDLYRTDYENAYATDINHTNEIIRVLAATRDLRAFKAILKMAEQKILQAILSLGDLADQRAVGPLMTIATAEDNSTPDEQLAATIALLNLNQKVFDLFVNKLFERGDSTSWAKTNAMLISASRDAIVKCCNLDAVAAMTVLKKIERAEPHSVPEGCISTAWKLIPKLEKRIAKLTQMQEARAESTLTSLSPDQLKLQIKSPDPFVRAAVIMRLAKMGEVPMELLEEVIEDPNAHVRTSATAALCQSGKDNAFRMISARIARPVEPHPVRIKMAQEIDRMTKNESVMFPAEGQNMKSLQLLKALEQVQHTWVEWAGKSVRLTPRGEENLKALTQILEDQINMVGFEALVRATAIDEIYVVHSDEERGIYHFETIDCSRIRQLAAQELLIRAGAIEGTPCTEGAGHDRILYRCSCGKLHHVVRTTIGKRAKCNKCGVSGVVFDNGSD